MDQAISVFRNTLSSPRLLSEVPAGGLGAEEQRVRLVDFADHFRPASGRHKWSLIFNDLRVGRINFCLAYFSPVSVRV